MGLCIIAGACTAERPPTSALAAATPVVGPPAAATLATPHVEGLVPSVRVQPRNDAFIAALGGDPTLAPLVASPPAACPSGMVLVDGSYCPALKHTCLRNVDKEGRYAGLRCAEFKDPPECAAARVPMRFCIDREEYSEGGEDLPLVNVSWARAAELCSARGARLCLEREWELACEGDEMRPYPYGFSRDSAACNIDQTHLGRPEQGLFDLRAKLDAFPACTSPFGVHDMTGNVDEWTVREDGKAPHRSALHGGWWLPGRNGCRPATLFHEETYQAKQVGFRCCGDPSAT